MPSYNNDRPKNRISRNRITNRTKVYIKNRPPKINRSWARKEPFYYKLIKILIICLLSIFPIYTLYDVFKDSIQTILATTTLPTYTLSQKDLDEDNAYLSIKRNIQKHYLSYDKYVPIENIFFTSKDAPLYPAIKKVCGDSSMLYVYLSLKFKIPLLGFFTKDICSPLKLDIK